MVLQTTQKKLTSPAVRQTLKKFKASLDKERVPFKELILFGSYSKGAAHKDSDIDVAVILPSQFANKQQTINRIPWLAKQIEVKLEPHILTRRDLNNPYLALISEIKKYGQKI